MKRAREEGKLRGVALPSGWTAYGSLLVMAHAPSNAPQAPTIDTQKPAAAFDFDGTLADTPLGGFDPTAWKMMFPHGEKALSLPPPHTHLSST